MPSGQKNQKIKIYCNKFNKDFKNGPHQKKILKKIKTNPTEPVPSSIAKRWKQHKCPLTNKWINKMGSTHTMEYYSAFKRKGILTHAATWMKLEDIMGSEISQSQKDKYRMIHLYVVPRVVRFRDRKENGDCQEMGGRGVV